MAEYGAACKDFDSFIYLVKKPKYRGAAMMYLGHAVSGSQRLGLEFKILLPLKERIVVLSLSLLS